MVETETKSNVSLANMKKIFQDLSIYGFNGIIKFSQRNVLGLPVSSNRLSIVIPGAFTLIWILNDLGIKTSNVVALDLEEIADMQRVV